MVTLKYRKKIYSSDDLPIFLFFKKQSNKKQFINELAAYVAFKEFVPLSSVDIVLAGNTVIKDKRSTLYFSLENIDEKRSLQKKLFSTAEESNAIISTPYDIKERDIEAWILRHIDHLK